MGRGFEAVLIVGTIVLVMRDTAQSIDGRTAFGASLACLRTAGPGPGKLGPACNHLGLPVAAKLLLNGLMLPGRREIIPVLPLLHSRRWTEP